MTDEELRLILRLQDDILCSLGSFRAEYGAAISAFNSLGSFQAEYGAAISALESFRAEYGAAISAFNSLGNFVEIDAAFGNRPATPEPPWAGPPEIYLPPRPWQEVEIRPEPPEPPRRRIGF